MDEAFIDNEGVITSEYDNGCCHLDIKIDVGLNSCSEKIAVIKRALGLAGYQEKERIINELKNLLDYV